jgi:hypothetical protein
MTSGVDLVQDLGIMKLMPRNLRTFWKDGMKRAWNEKIVIGMRGDGDEPMSRETATALLEKIVADQRNIIAEATGTCARNATTLGYL